jgi:Tfp pilus assembly protein PilF
MHPAMKRQAWHAAVVALLLAPGVLRAATLPVDAKRYYDTSRMWSAKHRDDLALSQIQKALLIAPRAPLLLAEEVRIQVRLGQLDAAQQGLAQLRTQLPDAPETQRIEDEYRVATAGRQEMAAIRLLARSGRAEEASRRLQALFVHGAPSGALGAEYNQILGGTAAGRPQAIAALRRTLAADPEDLSAELVLARLLNERATRAEAERYAHDLATRPDADHAAAMEVWRSVLKAASDDPAYLASLRTYASMVPDDTQMHDRLNELAAQIETQRRLQSDPAFVARQSGLAALERGDLATAETLLVRAARERPNDADALGGLGLLRMRTGHRDEASSLFLRAAAVAPDNRGKWLALAHAAQFWGALATGREALSAGRAQDAERAARVALQLDPNSEDARLLLANALVAQQRWSDAEPLLDALLDAPRPNLSAVSGLRAVYEHTQRAAQLPALLEALQNRLASVEDRQALAQMRAELFVAQAEQLHANGHDGPAADCYEAALKLTPDAAWTRFALARLYRDLGSPELGRQVMTDGVAASPTPSMRYAAALYANSVDDVRAAQTLLAGVPPDARTDGMRALARRLDVEDLLAAPRDASTDRLEEARTMAGDDPYLLASVGAAYIDAGKPDTGLAVLRAWIDAHGDEADVDVRLRYGDLLGSARRDRELKAWLAELRLRPGLTEHQRVRLEDQSLRLALREADAALDQHDYDGARAILASVSPAGQADKRYSLEVADLERMQGNYAAARAALAPILASAPDDADAQLSLARVLEASGAREAALKLTQRVLQQTAPDDVDTRLAVSRRLTALHETDEAHAVTAQLQTAYPQRSDVTVQAGRVAQSEQRYDDAESLYRTALLQEAAAGVSLASGDSPAQRALDRLNERRDPEVEAGWISAYKSGDAGISDYHAQQVPIYVQIPYRYDGHLFAHIDTVTLDAGTLSDPDVDSYTRNTFGTFAARIDDTPLAASLHQHAFGVALGVGYLSDAWRFDVGTTPLGFPVQYVVGGVRYRFETDNASLTIGASRRPETSSLLSYAGARDPVTGATWGGVRRDGIDLHGSIDIGKVNVFASLGAGELTGHEVRDNQEVTLRTGVDVPLYEKSGMRVSTGLIGNAWHYTNNLRFYTFGQGGYYSPQRYLSLGVPLEWTGRRNAVTWDIETVVGMSWTYERDSAYFPIGLPASANLQDTGPNVFTGGIGGGFSYAVHGSLEYRLNPRLAVGVRIDIEHSHDYAPSAALLYFRYAFAAKRSDDSLSPRPVRLYSGY